MRIPALSFVTTLPLALTLALAPWSPVPAGARSGEPRIVQDRGAAGAWQSLRKLTTIASLMHTIAHPDDEHGGMLTALSRGDGVRVSLMSLTRGEAGDNAIGPELFDALGLVRTEELLVAGRHYGLDALYFSTAADYGYSKRLDEALAIWGRERLVGDVVRAIRVDRPLVVVSRFQGTSRDGHGQHQAAGLVTREAFEAAGDPDRFPEQIAEGLRPWRPLRLYVGGVREDEPWTVRLDEARYSPVLGESFLSLARIGLAFQRSQNGGRVRQSSGPAWRYYRRVDGTAGNAERRSGLFDGIDVGLSGVFAWSATPPAPSTREGVSRAARRIADAVAAFDFAEPSRAVSALADALTIVRDVLETADLAAHPEAVTLLRIKERQLQDAVNACLGVELSADALPREAGALGRSPFAPPPTLGPVVPGQRIRLQATLTNPSALPVVVEDIEVVAPPGWRADADGARQPGPQAAAGAPVSAAFIVAVPDDAPPSRPYFVRDTIAEAHYAVRDEANRLRPFAPPQPSVRARYVVAGAVVTVAEPVRRWESRVPYGFVRRELVVVPAVTLAVSPRQAIVAIDDPRPIRLEVEVHGHRAGADGHVRLDLPDGWTASPASQAFRIASAGERRLLRWTVAAGALEGGTFGVRAVATVDGREYREGYDVVAHRDLETRRLYRDAVARVRAIDVLVASDLDVGYVMGIGDEVPQAIAQLGARVELLDDEALRSADLGRFDTIVTGTRAYAVRPELSASAGRLLEYVEAGGNLLVLYNTSELVPSLHAPYPAELPARSEEVSEEDAPVTILATDHRAVRTPNAISALDFDGWIEQRGSKFFAAWDDRYVAVVESQDRGQAPQRGGWLTASYGRGHYTYFAYALHRQLPYGVPGAYRLLANLLSLGSASGGGPAR